MPSKSSIVVTTINTPTAAMVALGQGGRERGIQLIVIGDEKGPAAFDLDGSRFFDVAAQRATGLAYAAHCPTRHYARKNIGYLIALRDGCQAIIETDDDNIPYPGFWAERSLTHRVPVVSDSGWLNVYRYFSDAPIWPRGLHLNAVQIPPPTYEQLGEVDATCPIQQGLANANPDVDSIYRLTLPLPQYFRTDRRVAVGRNAWCPFNSQNTTWLAPAFPLLYLPYYCSFRMTDIWRSFVAARIAWENDWHILFHEPTVYQDRNEHDLMRDFAEEIPGYLNNETIRQTLQNLNLQGGAAGMADDLRACYRALTMLGVVGEAELPLLEHWLSDITTLQASNP